MKLSVVIIAKNEAHIIGNTLQSLQGLTDDVIVVDSGSTDDTQEICLKHNARVLPISWSGYGNARNYGNQNAVYNWILNIDADEAIDETLKQSLLQLNDADENKAYELRFKTFLCKKHIRFGEWGGDKHIRLFNKNKCSWNNEGVHEGLIIPSNAIVKALPGYILHYTADNLEEYKAKTIGYAKLNAAKYFEQGKKFSPLKKYISSTFSFIQNYIFKLGFLDGRDGFWIAKNTAMYTYLKYAYLEKIK